MLGGCLVVGIVAAGLVVTPVGAGAAPGPDGVVAKDGPGPPRTVTLITGDRVTVAGRGSGRIRFERGKDRAGMTFQTYRAGGRLRVVPADAVALLRSGRLDPRLFDITGLLAAGYDGADALPLIVTYAPGTRVSAGAAVSMAGASVVRALPAVDGVAVRVDPTGAGDLWRGIAGGALGARTLASGLERVWLDGLRRPVLDASVPMVGGPIAWQQGYDGAGVVAAVLDSGIDATHPDLSGRVIAAENFTEGAEDSRDLAGHGTHVASTLAGSGAASGGRFRGVAPGARLLDGKVCASFGCQDSWIIAGMQWAVDHGADVVNMSFGGQDTPELDPVEQAVQALTARAGTLFVAAAGNSGPRAGSVESPASADAALAVGAVTKDDVRFLFSGRGPRTGDGAIKPDIAAPGVDISAARSADAPFGEPGDRYAVLTGTSMATPHVTGAAAILVQRHPDWTPEQIKASLMGAASPVGNQDVFGQGAGRLDVARALAQAVVAAPPSLSFGEAAWPHQDDTPISKRLTLYNHGTAAVTLALAFTVTGPDGAPAPAGMFSLNTATVTIAAGGQAEVSVVADPRAGEVDGVFGGRLTATGPGILVRVPVALEREVENYDLTLVHTGHDGAPAAFYDTTLLSTDGQASYSAYDPDGTATLRVPRGTYQVNSVLFGLPGVESRQTMLVLPRLTVPGTQVVNLDARLARPLSVTVPTDRVDSKNVDITAATLDATGTITALANLSGPDLSTVYTGQLGSGGAVDRFHSQVSVTLAEGGTDPQWYFLAWHRTGEMPTGLRQRVGEKDLATIRSQLRSHVSGSSGTRFLLPVGPVELTVSALAPDGPLPRTETAYVNTDGGVRWRSEFDEVVSDPENFAVVSSTEQPPFAYAGGRTYHDTWNAAPFAPTFAGGPMVVRSGDTLTVDPTLYGDGDGRFGWTTLATGRITILRDGTRIGETTEPPAVVEVPARTGRFQVRVETTRSAPAQLATGNSLEWTFDSGHVDGERGLPVSILRFSPRLDARNQAPAGTLFPVPVTIERQPGSAAAPNRTLTVEASFDDGATWRSVAVLPTPKGTVAMVPHPARAGYVSLRATAVDTAGNIVRQTLIRAYGLRPAGA
jgi:subtilisin family serine protease